MKKTFKVLRVLNFFMKGEEVTEEKMLEFYTDRAIKEFIIYGFIKPL